jgi:hypothetical protein
MPILRNIKSNSIFQAMFIGSLTGLVGVGIFILILQFPTDEVSEGEIVPTTQMVSEEQPEAQSFYALQFGVFTTFEGATQYLSAYPTLNKAAIVEVDGSYYIWSQLDREKVDGATVTSPQSFYKQVMVTSACQNAVENKIPSLLKDEKWLNGQAIDEADKQGVPEDWLTKIDEIQKLSSNVGVVRLHLLINYYEGLNCMKLSF